MKKFYSMACAIFVAALFALVACNDNPKSKIAKVHKLSVVTTIYPEFSWTKSILGNQTSSVDLSLLIKNGIDLHSFKPTAQDIAKIANADMVIYVGGESDEWIEKALEATPKKGRTEINLMKVLGDRVKAEESVEGMQAEEEHHHEHAEEHEHEHHDEHAEEHEHEEHHEHAEEHEHHEHHEHAEAPENDEHIWLSLKNAEILVKNIAESIAQLDPANAETYKANTDAYISKIRKLDANFTEALAGASQKTVLFGDRFPFRYLVDDYGIKYYAAFVGCSAESEASFETVAFLANKMDSLALPAIFRIEGGNGKIARTILDASKKSKQAQVLTLNSMQSVKGDQTSSETGYLSIMQSNLETLNKALK